MWEYLRRFASFAPSARLFLGGAFLVELGHSFLWTLQNLYVRSVGFGEADAGRVLAMNTLGILLATFPSAWLYERLGPRRSLALACGFASVGMIGLACSTQFGLMSAFAVLNGAAFCLHMVVAAPFIMSIARPEERSFLFGAEFATHTIGSTVGPLMAGFIAATLEPSLAETGALRTALVLGGVFGGLGVLVYGRLPDLQTDGEPVERHSLFQILGRAHRPLWIKLAIPNFIIGLGAGITIPFFNLYFTDRFDVAKDSLGMIMAATSVTMTIASLLTPLAAHRLGFVRAAILSEALSIPFFLVLAWTVSLPVAIGSVILRQALMNVVHPLWRNFMMEITPVPWRAAVNSVTALAWNLGWGFSVVFGGMLIESTAGLLGADVDGYALPMLFTIVLYLAAIAAEALFFWDQRHRGMLPSRVPETP